MKFGHYRYVSIFTIFILTLWKSSPNVNGLGTCTAWKAKYLNGSDHCQCMLNFKIITQHLFFGLQAKYRYWHLSIIKLYLLIVGVYELPRNFVAYLQNLATGLQSHLYPRASWGGKFLIYQNTSPLSSTLSDNLQL